MDDLISRQAAIDAFLTELTKRERTSLLHTWSTVEVKYFIAKILEQLPSAQPEYEELTPEEAASEIASGSIMSASYWFDLMIRLKQMGYAICRKVSEQHEST